MPKFTKSLTNTNINDSETMYYDKEWAMVRRINDGSPAPTYCATPVIFDKETMKKYFDKQHLLAAYIANIKKN